MIALDLDGTILNYGGHATEATRYNLALLPMLPPPATVAIRYHPDRYPTPLRVADRISDACNFLCRHRYSVEAIYISCYHPKAQETDIQAAAQRLREFRNPQAQQFFEACDAPPAGEPLPFQCEAPRTQPGWRDYLR